MPRVTLTREGGASRTVEIRELSATRAALEFNDIMLTLDCARLAAAGFPEEDLATDDLKGQAERWKLFSTAHSPAEGAKGYAVGLYLVDCPVPMTRDARPLAQVGLAVWDALLEDGWTKAELHAFADTLIAHVRAEGMGLVTAKVNATLDFSAPPEV